MALNLAVRDINRPRWMILIYKLPLGSWFLGLEILVAVRGYYGILFHWIAPAWHQSRYGDIKACSKFFGARFGFKLVLVVLRVVTRRQETVAPLDIIRRYVSQAKADCRLHYHKVE